MIAVSTTYEAKTIAMKHHESFHTKIYANKNIGLFKLLTGNRDLNLIKIKRIKKDIQSGLNMMRYFPILVTKDMVIIDGQHRFMVCKELDLPVYYIIVQEDLSLADIAQFNSRTEKWKLKDFVNAYSQLGNNHYKVLGQFVNSYQFSYTDAVGLLMHGTSNQNGSVLDLFRTGQFEVKYSLEATEIAEKVSRFRFFTRYKNKAFIRAIETLHKGGKCDFDRLAEKVENRLDQFEGKVSAKEYLTQLELFYNHGLSKRAIIY
jgi:hypothetical protein